MANAHLADLGVADVGIGALSIGSKLYPKIIHLDVRQELEDADVFIGHIADRLRKGDDPLFDPSNHVLLAAAVALASEPCSQEAEKHLLYMELTGHCRGMEDTSDASAIVEAVQSIALSIRGKLEDGCLYENGKLNYGIGRVINGQLELVRKTFDDPSFRPAVGGFLIPSWIDSQT